MANDFAYRIGVDIDSGGIDAFMAKVRGLASGVNFGSNFQIPQGITAAGSGISGTTANFTNPGQAHGFTQSLSAALNAQLAAARTSGVLGREDAQVAQREIDRLSRALAAGAKRFEQVLGGIKGTPTSAQLEDARVQSSLAIERDLAESDKREIRNAKRREARAAKRNAEREENASRESDEDVQARRDATAAHRREAQAARRAAQNTESTASEAVRHEAQKNAEKRRAAAAAKKAADAEVQGAGGGRTPPPPPPPKRPVPPGGDGGDDDDEIRKARVREAQEAKRGAAREANKNNKAKTESQIADDLLKARQQELVTLRARLAITGQNTELDRDIARAKAQVLLAERQQARLEREQNQYVFQQARDEGFFNVGTRAQRVQAAFKSRDGQLADPLGERRLGALVGQRVFQASSFAVGGLAFYGALQVLRDTLEETEKLEREFFVVRGQIDRTFGDESGAVFDRFKERIRDISQTTGQLGSEVAFVTRQLSAAFVDPDATPAEQSRRFELAGDNAEQAFKFAEVTGLESTEITDSLTALGLSFPELDGDFRSVLDSTIALEEEWGVLGGQIITFAADLAPLGAQLGFNAQQLTELGAAAQKFSGRSGGALAEQFGRILTDLPTKAPELIALFSQTPELADMSKGLADAFVADNMQQVLQFVLQAAQRTQDQGLGSGLVQKISETVAGRREGASFAAILRQPGDLLEALQTDNDRAMGAVDRRWSEVRDSLMETMERLRRAVEQFAEAILSAGLADAFKLIANGLSLMARAAGEVVRWFDKINDATGGMAGLFLGLYGTIRLVNGALNAMASSRVLGLLLGTGGGAAAGRGATLLSNVAQQGVLGYALNAGRAAPAAARAAVSGGLTGLAGRVGSGVVAGLAGARLASLGGTFFNPANATLGTAAGVAAPVTALVALNQLRLTVQDVRGSIKDQGDALRLQMQEVSIRDLINAFSVGDTDTRILGIPGTQSVGRAILGGDLPEDLRKQVFAERAGPEGLSAGLSAIDTETLNPIQQESYARAYLEIEKAMRGEEADLDAVADFLGTLGAEKTETADAVAEAVDAALTVEDAAKEATEGSSGPEFQLLLQALQGGRSTPEAVRNALQSAIAPLQTLADAALEAGDYTAYLTRMEAIAQLREAADQGISQYVASSVNFSEQIRGIFGDSTPQTQIATATSILQNPNVTDDATRLQALEQLQSAREAAFQARLDQARNERERLDILAEGPGSDPIVQAEAVYQQVRNTIEAKLAELRQKSAEVKGAIASGEINPSLADAFDEGGFDSQIQSMEGVTREDITAISAMLIEDIEEYGEGAIRIRLALLQARAAELRKTIFQMQRMGGFDSSALRDELQQITGQIETYTALSDAGVDPSTLVTDDQTNNGLTADQERDRLRREAEYSRDMKLAQINRAKAGAAGDPVREAQLSQQAAQVSLDFAREQFGPDSIEAINAEGELIGARMQARSAAKELALAQIAVGQAAAAGDPVAEARLSIQAARVAQQFATGPIEALQAQAQMITALHQQRDAYNDIGAAQLELHAAHVAGDPVAAAAAGMQQADFAIATATGTADRIRAQAQRVQAGRAFWDAIFDVRSAQLEFAAAEVAEDPVAAARAAIQQADFAVATAQGTAERLRAEAQRVSAHRAFGDAIRDITTAQVDLAIAIAESGGDAVEASRLRLEQANAELWDTAHTHDEAGIARARADVVVATRAYQDSILSKQREDIDFALEMENITKRQAIESYQALLSIPTNTEAQNRELMLAIKNLQEAAGADLQFNLPTQLGLPTAYAVTRVSQGEGAGYNDNRIITVNISANTNASATDIAAAVSSVVGEPNRYGITPRRY